MLLRSLYVLALAALAIAEVNAQGLTNADAQAFFERYIALGDAYDDSLADLYSNDSRIRSNRRYPNGQSRTMEMTGAQWKSLIRSAMPNAKIEGDRSEYKHVRVEPVGRLMRIKADRYSVRKCYWDRGYYMLIGRQSDGKFRIVEEYLDTQQQSNC